MASWEDDRLPDDQQSSHSHSLSRLATCTSSSTLNDDHNFDNYDDDGFKTMFSGLSIESFDVVGGGDADHEFSDGTYGTGGGQVEDLLRRGCLFSDSDDDDDDKGLPPNYYSLPATPLQQQRFETHDQIEKIITKQYASENDEQKLMSQRRRKRVLRRKKREARERTEEFEDSIAMKMEMSGGGEKGLGQFYGNIYSSNSFSGESEGGGGLRVITRPKGGRRSLCMDMEEVKACRDLGFELEHQQMFDMTATPSRLTLSTSTLDTATTSSGGSSPIPNWRISSPGDDPKDVKARLKVWAQAVAIASTSRQGGTS